MADQSASKQFNFGLVSGFAGYNSTNDPTKLAPNFMVRGSLNMYKKVNGNISVRDGQKLRGEMNSANSPISSEFVWNTSWGATYIMIISEGFLQVEVNNVFYDLKAFTETRFVFDKWWSDSEKKDRLLMVNGTSDMFDWSGGVAFVDTSGTNSITKTDPTISWQQTGFSITSGEKKVMIGGVEYTYTAGENTDTLTGVTPDTSGITPGAIVLQSVLTESDTPAAGFNADFLKVVKNQVYVGSYTSRLLYISSAADFTDYSEPDPRTIGDPAVEVLDSNLRGISVKNGNAYVSAGTGEWAIVSFQASTDPTTGANTENVVLTYLPVTKNGAAYAHEFIGNSGDNIIYLSQDQQLRIIGDFNDLFVKGYPSLSLEVNTEFEEEDFEGGGLKCIGEFTYLTAPTSGKTYLYQVRQSINNLGTVNDERLWHAPFVWNATRIDDINGVTHAFSNANPQIYQVWGTNQWHDDSPSGEPLPYTCVMAMAYQQAKDRAVLVQFDKFYSEGYLTEGSEINLLMNYEYQGSGLQVNAIINSVKQPATLFGLNVGSLGDNSLGTKPLGMEILEAGTNDLIKFRCINSLTLKNCFEFQPIIYSENTDAHWEIEAFGTNAGVVDEQQPTFLINKQ